MTRPSREERVRDLIRVGEQELTGDDLAISRGIMVVEGDYIACQTTITGTFVREFTQSPIGPLPPNGRRVTFELINIFRYDDHGRLAEEWVQTDNRSRLRQLGAEGR